MSSEIHLTSLSNVVTTTESKSVSLGVGLKTYCQYFYAVSDGITIISRAGPHPWQGPLPVLVVLSSIVSLCFLFPSSLGLRMHNIGTIRTTVRHSSISNKVTSSNQVAK